MTDWFFENVRLSMTIPRGSIYKRPTFGHRFGDLSQAVASETTRRRAEQYGREALQWMLDVGRATSVQASATYARDDVLLVSVEVIGLSNRRASFSRFVEISYV